MTLQSDHAPADEIGCCALDDCVYTMAKYRTTHQISYAGNANSAYAVGNRRGDDFAAVGVDISQSDDW